MHTRIKYLSLVLFLLISTMTAAAARAQDDEALKQHLIEVVAQSEIFADWLTGYPDYIANASGPDDNNVWYVEFYNDDSYSEWLGYANIDADTDEIQDSFAPRPLPADVYQEQLPRVNASALADPEVLARLNGNPDLWDIYTDWNRWEAKWDVVFYRGIEAVLVRLSIDENDNIYLENILDPNQLSAEEALDNARNTAINLAYSGDGVGQALEGHDDWTTYAEQQGDNQWSITFAANDEQLAYVLVDVSSDEILDVQVGE
jgi:hypothetical protein